MYIARRLSQFRKNKGFTQQALADAIGLHVTQIKRYEAGNSQPSLEALKKIAKTLRVTTDSLIFEQDELEPSEELALQFQVISQMPKKERQIIQHVLESLIIKYETQKWANIRKVS